jgi:hypothetical protein
MAPAINLLPSADEAMIFQLLLGTLAGAQVWANVMSTDVNKPLHIANTKRIFFAFIIHCFSLNQQRLPVFLVARERSGRSGRGVHLVRWLIPPTPPNRRGTARHKIQVVAHHAFEYQSEPSKQVERRWKTAEMPVLLAGRVYARAQFCCFFY